MLYLSINSCNISFQNFVQCFVKIITIKVDQQLEKLLNTQLFTIGTIVNKCCRNGLCGNVTPERISRHRFLMNDIMKSRLLRAISHKNNWVPNKNSEVCSLHCHDSYFVTDRADSSSIRGINKEKLTKRSLMITLCPQSSLGCPVT